MPRIITLAHQKGGVGKSTLCLNLAYSLCQDARVAVVDYDLQGTLVGLKPVVTEFQIHSYEEDFEELVKSLDIDFLIVDTPPYLSHNLMPLFLKSDLVIVPTKVGYADVMAIRATIKLIKQAQQDNPALKMAVVLNMVKHRTSMTDEIKGIIKDFGVDILPTHITDRVSYIRSLVGKGVVSGEDAKAIDETNNFALEAIKVLMS